MRTAASCWFIIIQIYDARNHKHKILLLLLLLLLLLTYISAAVKAIKLQKVALPKGSKATSASPSHASLNPTSICYSFLHKLTTKGVERKLISAMLIIRSVSYKQISPCVGMHLTRRGGKDLRILYPLTIRMLSTHAPNALPTEKPPVIPT